MNTGVEDSTRGKGKLKTDLGQWKDEQKDEGKGKEERKGQWRKGTRRRKRHTKIQQINNTLITHTYHDTKSLT